MGFDNECIVNIQTLAGEYFCPVCRLLVYPNEALQSQCTHLYCKPCLTYIVCTTRACPYDGYLVTEADSKPLTESDKTLAETIGKIAVHCLYHRSGCTWQGSLSECTSHCSGCAFGNSPVVCNRCGIQIVHRQVQEHAQNCPGVQPQAQQGEATQDTSATSAAVPTGQTQTVTQVGTAASQASTATTTPGQDSNHQANPNSQTQAVVQTVVQSTPEQWYQQQQYQQYYQQYPGYDQYQQQYQQYYPYQQPVVPQAQPQVQVQPQLQAQPQSQSLGQSQTLSHAQAPLATQSQNQAQVNPQQQVHLAMQPHTQIQSLTQPPAPGHPQTQPQPYAYPQVQPNPTKPQTQQHMQIPYYQQPPQMQHQQPQIQQQAQSYPVSQPRPNSQLQTHAPVPHNTQPQPNPSQPNQPSHPNVQPQMQHTSAHAVTGHNSYPQPQPHQQMQLGAPQHPSLIHPQGGPQSQSHHPVQLQHQFPQQPPYMHPHQSHAPFPNQQQLASLPSAGQGQNVPPPHQQTNYAHSQQPGHQVHQRPVMQPVQQHMPQQYVQQQQPYAQQQMPMSSHLRPQGPPHSFPQHTNTYLQPQDNVAFSHNIQHNQSQNAVGRPMMPNAGIQSQPFSQSASGIPIRPTHPVAGQPSGNQNMLGSNNQVQLSSGQQFRVSGPTERQGDLTKQQMEFSQKNGKKAGSDLDAALNLGRGATEMKSVKSETDMKDENKQMGEEKTSLGVSSAQEIAQSTQIPGIDMKSYALENGKVHLVKEEAAESTLHPVSEKSGGIVFEHQNDTSNERVVVKDKEIQDGPSLKISSSQGAELLEEQSGTLLKDDTGVTQPTSGADKSSISVSTSSAHGVDEYRNFPPPPPGQAQSGGFLQPSHPVPFADLGKHQHPLIHYGPTSVQQRPAAISMMQASHPGLPEQPLAPGHAPTQFRNQVNGPIFHPAQPLKPTEHFHSQVFKQPHGPEIQPSGVHGPGIVPPFGREPTNHGQNFEPQSLTPLGPFNQGHATSFPSGNSKMSRGEPVEGSHFGVPPSGGFDPHGGMMAKAPAHPPEGLRGQNGPSLFGLQEERFKPSRSNPFPLVTSEYNINRGEFEDDLKKFPRPSRLDAEPVPRLGSYSLGAHDMVSHGVNYDRFNPGVGGAASRFFPPPHLSSELAERPGGFHDDAIGKSDSAHSHADYIGPGPGYGRHHIDGMNTRSPVSRSGIDDFDVRDSGRFGDPITFHDSRFPHLPNHLRRGEFEGPGNMRMGENFRSDFVGHDCFTGHLRRGEHLGPPNFNRHLQLGEPHGFGGHTRIPELVGPGSFESFGRGNRQGHPRLGEPGFRSSFSLQGFRDGGPFTGDTESFDNMRKRKAASMGWCRICKVDCETVEGLDLHSQKREHQKMAMDMVKSIKHNAKKHKLTHNEQSSIEDASKPRNASLDGRGNKH
ncbi:Mediator of RNA polymerase II transcription subunit 12-like protein [Quillaja saponaria]|uniref:Mediator of RNA polymerase II transcription subunit 12-like protein n=1 Tax=Quillaja saponaria TaxID=32244 RepID=A0AAD7P9Z5_QUISA|nr:Mediator of RNA polymerase II transcription subunit 12-like protein [Quillaja saponaria]